MFCVFTIDVVPFIVKLPVASISPVIFKSPTKSNLVDGVDNPIPTFPSESITNEVESGLVESSTTRAFPVPFCVILTKSPVVEPDAIIEPSTFRVDPSNLKLFSTIAFG